MQPQLELPPGLASGRAAFLRGCARGLAKPPVVHVSAWAAAHRVVSAESGSPYPGKWDPSLAPYTLEIEDCCSFTHPCRDVAIKKSAQVGCSEIGLNTFGSIAAANPCPVLIVLPTLDEAKKYNRIKLQPLIDSTPAVREAVEPMKSRDEDSSTAHFKRYRGGYCVVTGANSSAGLQMISARVIIFEEVSEYPADAGGRGDPVEQAESRQKAWLKRRVKRIKISTPNIVGDCRVSDSYALSDQRRLYVPCPQCGTYQVLIFPRLRWGSETPPHRAYYVCGAHGCIVPASRRDAMVARGIWLKCYADKERPAEAPADPNDPANPPPPEFIAAADIGTWIERRGHRSPSHGREPGFAIWQAYSRFVSWDDTVAEYLRAKGAPGKLKVFWQQALGEPWEEKGEAPPAEKLLERRQAFPSRRVPYAALFLTMGVDVQGDRIEFAVYAWAAKMSEGWLIDRGIIVGDPATDAPWHELARVINRTYEDAKGRPVDIDGIGIDSGFLSNRVYLFCRSMQPTAAGTRRVFACDGRPGWKLPAVGSPSMVDVNFEGKKIGAVALWKIGTWDMKSEHYAALRATLQGPGADGAYPVGTLHFNDSCDLPFFEQQTAEVLQDRKLRTGLTVKEWANPGRKRNEQLDMAVYARAIAHHLSDSLTPGEWAALAARRAAEPESVQGDLARLWSPDMKAQAEAEIAAATEQAKRDAHGVRAERSAAPAERQEAGDSWLGGRGGDWFGRA